jgi:hypothetical protein
MDSKAKGQPSGPVVFTANRLGDGRVVWLAPGDRWSESLADAQIFEGDAVAQVRAIAEAWARRQIIVGPYDVPVEPESKSPSPLTMRERIRAHGPSVGPDSAEWRRAATAPRVA